MDKNEAFTDRFPDRPGHDRADGRGDVPGEGSRFSRLPTTNQPLNAEPRPRLTPLLAVAALIAVIVLVFLLITWLRYNS